MARRRVVLQICDLKVISFHLHCTCLFISQYLLGVKLIHIYIWIYGIKLLVFKDYLKVFNYKLQVRRWTEEPASFTIGTRGLAKRSVMYFSCRWNHLAGDLWPRHAKLVPPLATFWEMGKICECTLWSEVRIMAW